MYKCAYILIPPWSKDNDNLTCDYQNKANHWFANLIRVNLNTINIKPISHLLQIYIALPSVIQLLNII